MKLKLIINGSEFVDDYKLLKTTVSTVASLRKTAVLRFNNERLIIISTPKSSSSASTGTILYGDTGQLWCTIPKDVFKLYTVISARELSSITMESNCDSLLSVFKRYDRVLSQGSSSNMTIKLQSMPEWNTNNNSSGSENSNGIPNPICALGITFEEIVHTNDNGADGNNDDHDGMITSMLSGSNKVIMHSFKVPVKLLFRAQDARIQEPMINYTQLMMYRLPPISGEFGNGFYNFIRRVERYTNVNHLRLSGKQNISNEADAKNVELKIVVNELDWHLEICWNGILDPIIQPQLQQEDDNSQKYQANAQEPQLLSLGNIGSVEENSMQIEENSMEIEDSEVIGSRNQSNYKSNTADHSSERGLEDISTMVEKAERENTLTHEVIIRSKDWKVCAKLYNAFEEVVLAISHDESCVFHCSLDRGNIENGEGNDQGNTQHDIARERGQIIYYMARSKAL